MNKCILLLCIFLLAGCLTKDQPPVSQTPTSTPVPTASPTNAVPTSGARGKAPQTINEPVAADRLILTTVPPRILQLAEFPPREAPYQVENGEFWLVHSPEGDVIAFSPVSPYDASCLPEDACRFGWVDELKRFVDPCSGDEWELDGRLNLEHSTELWSNRDLDRYMVEVREGVIFVQLDQLIRGRLVGGLPLIPGSSSGPCTP